MISDNAWSSLFSDWPSLPVYRWSVTENKNSLINDGKARINTPGANKENLKISVVDGQMTLKWPGPVDENETRITVPSGFEPIEAEVKDGITTISFQGNKRTIPIK